MTAAAAAAVAGVAKLMVVILVVMACYCPEKAHADQFFLTAWPCPKGMYCPSESSTYYCPAFSYQDEENQARCKECQACPQGYYMVTDLASYAVENNLDPDSISNYCGTNIIEKRTSAQRICIPCPAGFYCPFFPNGIALDNDLYGTILPCTKCFLKGKYPVQNSSSCNRSATLQTKDTICADCPSGSVCR
jgi:hypothetical protein